MNEHLSLSDKSSDPLVEARIDHLVDSGVYNYGGARYQVNDEEVEVSAARRAQIKANHPSQGASYRQNAPRYDGETFPVIDNSELSNEQIATNSHGVELAKRALHANDPPQTAEDIARARAKKERQARNY